MARKQTAKELREQAQKLIDQAKKLEEAEFIKIGSIVKKYMDNDFKDFDLAKFKKALGLKAS